MGTTTLARPDTSALTVDEIRVVALAGDWHGETEWARHAVDSCDQIGAQRIYHLGDFGVWPGPDGVRYLDEIEERCEFYNLDIWVTPGNHEDYYQIKEVPIGPEGLQWIRPHIGLIPRGHRWEDGGRSFVSLGGAPSIDFEHRSPGRSWWREEMITREEAKAVADAGFAEIFLAHDCPDGATREVEQILRSPSGWSFNGLSYAAEGRQRMNEAYRGVQPRLFAHGHYHVRGDSGPSEGTRFLSLPNDWCAGNVVLLRLSDLQVSWDGGREWD